MRITDLLPATLFRDKTVFVTGGTSGINLGIARSFAALGASLAICGRSRVKGEHAAQGLRALGGEVRCHVLDVRDADALLAAMEQTGQDLGPIHTLVAGVAGNFPCRAEDSRSL